MIRTNDARQAGRTIFGRDAAGYEAGRLDYPPALYALLVEQCGLAPGARVFEVGPGTGQATRALVAAGAMVTAVEPDPALCRTLAAAVPGISTIKNATLGSAELPVGGFDLGVAATSFGWLDPATEYSRIFKALRPGGWWAMWWNVFQDLRGDPIFDRGFEGLLHHRAFRGGGHYALRREDRIADLARIGLPEPTHIELTTRAMLTPGGLRALYATFSPLRSLPDDEFARRLDQVEMMAADEAVGGHVERQFRMPVYFAQRPFIKG
jgi:SAM-dependent methyltransferase